MTPQYIYCGCDYAVMTDQAKEDAAELHKAGWSEFLAIDICGLVGPMKRFALCVERDIGSGREAEAFVFGSAVPEDLEFMYAGIRRLLIDGGTPPPGDNYDLENA